jgi:dTDP-4-amino-4,6-dideoxygalactose transaminase
MGTIPFLDLKKGLSRIRAEVDEAIVRIIDNTAFVLGPELDQFEKEFASFCDTTYCAGTSSGTAALHLALLGHSIGPGDEVITVPNTFVATVEAIAMTGATPVLADILEDTWLMDPAAVERAITPKTKAIISVALFGQCCDMDRLMDIARNNDIILIDDTCQAHGATYKKRRAGSLGHASAFSFYPSKNLGAFGEGGAVTSDDEGLIERIKSLRHHAQVDKNVHGSIGYNYRLEALQAAVLRVKLRYLDEWNDGRRAAAARYRENLEGTSYSMPVERTENRHVYHLFPVRCKDKEVVQEALSEAGIGWGEHYPIPIHLQPAFSYLGKGEGSYPVAEATMRSLVTLPMFPELTIGEVDRVCEVLKSVDSA